MLENCSICGIALINGRDGKQQIRYPSEWLQKFKNGEITLEELNKHAEIYYTRERLCNTDSLPSMEGNPCPNYHGGNMSDPVIVVETIEIPDN
jgi:hypothetical protein